MNAVIERFKRKLEAENPATTSEDTSSFPLATYLLILERAGDTAFNNHCAGAKALHHWLTYGQQRLTLPHPYVREVPRLASGYLTFEIAKVIAGPLRSKQNYKDWLEEVCYIHSSIYTSYTHPSHTYHIRPIPIEHTYKEES